MAHIDLAWKIYQFYCQCSEEDWSTANIEAKLVEWGIPLPDNMPKFKIGQMVNLNGRALRIHSILVEEDGFFYRLYMDEIVSKLVPEFKLLEQNNVPIWSTSGF